MRPKTDYDDLISLAEKIKASNTIQNSGNDSEEILIEISKKLDQISEHSEKLWKILLIAIKDTLTIEEASLYTSISKSEFYQKTSKKEIEFSKPVKQVFFRKEVLNKFLNQNPQSL